MTTRCQHCNQPYFIDLMVPDQYWRLITPGDPALLNGLLCGVCIMARLEERAKNGHKYDYLFVTEYGGIV